VPLIGELNVLGGRIVTDAKGDPNSKEETIISNSGKEMQAGTKSVKPNRTRGNRWGGGRRRRGSERVHEKNAGGMNEPPRDFERTSFKKTLLKTKND